jgi:hypothetical protein
MVQTIADRTSRWASDLDLPLRTFHAIRIPPSDLSRVIDYSSKLLKTSLPRSIEPYDLWSVWPRSVSESPLRRGPPPLVTSPKPIPPIRLRTNPLRQLNHTGLY